MRVGGANALLHALVWLWEVISSGLQSVVVASAGIAPVPGRGLAMWEQLEAFAKILNFYDVEAVTLCQGDQWCFPNCPKAKEKNNVEHLEEE